MLCYLIQSGVSVYRIFIAFIILDINGWVAIWIWKHVFLQYDVIANKIQERRTRKLGVLGNNNKAINQLINRLINQFAVHNTNCTPYDEGALQSF